MRVRSVAVQRYSGTVRSVSEVARTQLTNVNERPTVRRFGARPLTIYFRRFFAVRFNNSNFHILNQYQLSCTKVNLMLVAVYEAQSEQQ